MTGTARHQLRNRMPRGYFADAPECAKSSSPQWGNCDEGVHGAGGGELSHAAGNPADQFAGRDAYSIPVASLRIAHAQQLHAARVISGRAQGLASTFI